MTEYVIPYLHPLAVHFPLALLLTGAGTAVLYALTGTAFWRKATLLLFLLGFVGAIVARQSGEAMEEDVEGEEMAELFLEDHEAMANRTILAAGLTLLILVVAEARAWTTHRRKDPLWLRFSVVVLAVLSGVLVAYTGHLGGLMVWGIPAG